MTTRGFILGKFMPPHCGHLFLCETASQMVDELTVLVCSIDAEPMDGALRFQWMKEALPNANVIHMHREIPQEPDDHPDFWTIWQDAIREYHPEPIDKVFASEIYVFHLAKKLNATPVLIDPDREVFPVSGTAIRNDPAAYWANLAPPARAHFQKRICLLGPESVGKSHLAADLAAHFGTRAMPEYGRTYDVHYKQRLHAQGENWKEVDLLAIAETHAAMRAALAPHTGPLLFEDTDAIQTAAWAEHLLGKPSEALGEFIDNDPHADHYLLLAHDVEWIDDGVRYAGDEKVRAWFFKRLEVWLKALKLNYTVIRGTTWSERTAQAIKIVTALPLSTAGPANPR